VRRTLDSDTRAVRRASRMVGLQITVASAAIVLAVVLGVFLFVLARVKPAELFEAVPDPDKVNVSAVLLLRTAVGFGLLLIVVAGVLSWLVARHAVRPLGTALRMQRSFVADASHELRTPLTVLDARRWVRAPDSGSDFPSCGRSSNATAEPSGWSAAPRRALPWRSPCRGRPAARPNARHVSGSGLEVDSGRQGAARTTPVHRQRDDEHEDHREGQRACGRGAEAETAVPRDPPAHRHGPASCADS
jgi:hypothetical protein